MIKTFEQFILEKYGSPINEAFQSNKLRQIIKQHGLPKNDWDKKMLYDLKDNEIVDVLNSREEYWKKYSDDRLDDEQATFMVELEDGAVIVISNLDIFYNQKESIYTQLNNKFNTKHSERHKGNLGKHYRDDHDKHLDKVYEIEQKRLIEKLKGNIDEIVDWVKDGFDAIFETITLDDITDDGEFDHEMTLDGEKYIIRLYYSSWTTDTNRHHGAEWCRIGVQIEQFIIINEKDIEVENEVLGITKDNYKDLFKEEYTDDVEYEIYDYDKYYGVKPSDFY